MSWLPESHRVRATEHETAGIGGRTPADRHGETLDQATLLPDYDGSDWTDEEAELESPEKARVRGRLRRINARGVCGGCWIMLQAVGDCQNCN
jgi:hypothetical protein